MLADFGIWKTYYSQRLFLNLCVKRDIEMWCYHKNAARVGYNIWVFLSQKANILIHVGTLGTYQVSNLLKFYDDLQIASKGYLSFYMRTYPSIICNVVRMDFQGVYNAGFRKSYSIGKKKLICLGHILKSMFSHVTGMSQCPLGKKYNQFWVLSKGKSLGKLEYSEKKYVGINKVNIINK